VGIAGHSFQLLFRECDYPRAFVWWIGCHGLLFLVLFSNFYRREYLLKRKIAKEKRELANATAMQEDESRSSSASASKKDSSPALGLSLRRSRLRVEEKTIQ